MLSFVPVGLAIGIVSTGVINIFSPAPWSQYGANAQHTALSTYPSQTPQAILWSAPVDLNPQYSGADLLIHYGSPMVTKLGTVITSIKTGSSDGFEFRAYNANGSTLWTQTTDYSVPPHDWGPSCGGTLDLGSLLIAMPAAGGTLLFRGTPDSATGAAGRHAFYGNALYNADPATYNANVKICSPLMAAPNGVVYFGFRVFEAQASIYRAGSLGNCRREAAHGFRQGGLGRLEHYCSGHELYASPQ